MLFSLISQNLPVVRLQIFRKILFFEVSCLSPHWTSQWTASLTGLPLSWTAPLKGLDLSMDCPSHWTEPVKCSLHTEPSTDWTSHWTAPLNGLDLSWTGPLTGLDLAMDCSCSGLPDFLVEFFLKNLGLLDLLSRSKRSLLPLINHIYWLVNIYSLKNE